jgi:hypothetical protein
MRFLLLLVPGVISSCANVQVNNDRYGFIPTPGMDVDAQDRNNTKYNLLDSSDGSNDPTANIKIWGTKY